MLNFFADLGFDEQVLINRLEDYAYPGKVWLGKLTGST